MDKRPTSVKVIGTLIRNERSKRNISQRQLAEGICSQGTISKIERNNTAPNLKIIEMICKRLDLALNNALSYTGVIVDRLTQVELAILDNNYPDASELLDLVLVHNLDTTEEKIRYYCYRGLLELHWHSDLDRAVANFVQINSLSKSKEKFYIAWSHIGMGITMYEKGLDDASFDLIKTAQEILENLDYEQITLPLLTRAYTDMILLHGQFHKYTLMLKLGNHIKQYLVKKQSMVNLSMIYLLLGRASSAIDDELKATEFFSISRALAIIRNDYEILELLNKESNN